jgi:alpha-L-fucosidase
MNDSWGYIPGDSNFKSVQQCLCTLIRIRAGGGNLLLNTNPNGDGSMPPQCVKVFRELGSWLANNGESIYGCQLARMAPHCAGFFSQPGLITARPDKHVVYYHILRWLGRNEHCAKISAKITSARLLLDGTQVKFRQKGHMVYFLDLPKNAPDKLDTVIKINYAAGTERLFYKKNMFIT